MPETTNLESTNSPDSTPINPITATPETMPVEASSPEALPDLSAIADTAPWWSSVNLDSLFGLIKTGGPVVAILLVLSIFALTVILLKLGRLLWAGVGRRRRVRHAERLWLKGDRAAALALVDSRRNPVAKVLAHGMRGLTYHQTDEATVREDVERVALSELANLRSLMKAIEAVVQVAPLLGLFGTVLGMIDAFRALQSAGAEADPAVLAGGIWVALLTTAVGLAIAIPSALVLYWFEGIIERERVAMEEAMTALFTGRITETITDLTLPPLARQADLRSPTVNGTSPDIASTAQIAPALSERVEIGRHAD